MTRWLWVVAAATATVLVVAVIGTTRPSEDEEAVEATVDSFLAAVGNDGNKACRQLSREAQARLTRQEHETSCKRAAESATAVRELRELTAGFYDFGAIEFGPEHAWAHVHAHAGPSGEEFGFLFPPIELEQGDGHWAISSLKWFYTF